MGIETNFQPLVASIAYQSPRLLFECFADQPWNILIDGSNDKQIPYGTNRYSYILIDPFERYVYDRPQIGDDPLLWLRHKIAPYRTKTIPGLPPFQGGVAGHLSYDLIHLYYPVPSARHQETDCPYICLGFYDLVCSFDHMEQKTYLISTGWPEQNTHKRLQRAEARLAWLQQYMGEHAVFQREAYEGISRDTISSNFTQDQYINAVNKVVHYIKSGDIFEVNLAQRFSATIVNQDQSFTLYQKLCDINPAPFSAFLNFGEHKIISASPERFIQLQDRCVETRPIKGTAARHSDPVQDQKNSAALLKSEKDIAENIMIVDLMRNDLSKICEDDSVVVTQLCAHESYPTVHHLVSVIEGRLKESEDAFSVLKAIFPGGLITGAPKIRAMQIIAEMEPDQRGPYCGSIIIAGFDGYMDSSITIRTYVLKNDKVSFHAGGAIVLDSDPMAEYEETQMKAYALQKALCKG